MTYHPKKNDQGKPVHLSKPSTPTDASTWLSPEAMATATPGCALPAGFSQACEAIPSDWESLAATMPVSEPAYPTGKTLSAGAIVFEPDGRIWLVSPSNGFGGYQFTFPKGKRDGAESLKALALKEVWEESGLIIRLTGFLGDFERTTSTCRLYLAERISGNPAEMGWETQAVHLVPKALLASVLHHPTDLAVLDTLKTYF